MFSLHKAVQTQIVIDVYKPIGGWKKESTSTAGVIDEKQVVFEYGSPGDIPLLIENWFELYHEIDQSLKSNEATIEIIDVEMGKDAGYLTVGKTPLKRVHKLLSKLNSIRVNKDRGIMVSKEAEALLNKFVQQVESIFNHLPKVLK